MRKEKMLTVLCCGEEGLGCDCFSVVYYGAASMRLFMRLRLNA